MNSAQVNIFLLICQQNFNKSHASNIIDVCTNAFSQSSSSNTAEHYTPPAMAIKRRITNFCVHHRLLARMMGACVCLCVAPAHAPSIIHTRGCMKSSDGLTIESKICRGIFLCLFFFFFFPLFCFFRSPPCIHPHTLTSAQQEWFSYTQRIY